MLKSNKRNQVNDLVKTRKKNQQTKNYWFVVKLLIIHRKSEIENFDSVLKNCHYFLYRFLSLICKKMFDIQKAEMCKMLTVYRCLIQNKPKHVTLKQPKNTAFN